ncbi:phosphatidylserine decarboxylase [Streptomyces goshikiensis]|uniref:phosphatidylserine decarboxylase n=1 Tax=Streptomyces goshikiensis TaxID=1942 RepID=UPI002E0D5975|nr:phosphatidylserine decarboxylase [Streptomyces goshikiensis]
MRAPTRSRAKQRDRVIPELLRIRRPTSHQDTLRRTIKIHCQSVHTTGVASSPLNVHVNRALLAGTVTSVEHIPGGFVPAFNKESENNERVVWHFDTELGDIEMVQIAGAVARRIVPYLPAGTKVEQGERIGLIRFGSRVDIYLPAGVEVAVEVGDRTRAGVTRVDRG